jgi:hypothetical protein
VHVLASRVERLEVQEFDPSMGTRRITESSDDRSVDHTLVFSMRSMGNKKYNIIGREGTISTDGSQSLPDDSLRNGRGASQWPLGVATVGWEGWCGECCRVSDMSGHVLRFMSDTSLACYISELHTYSQA